MRFEQLLAAGPLDWLALLTSLAYVWLAARDDNRCWWFAAVATAVWAYQSFVVYRLVSDGLLQVFYFVMAAVGLWRWRGRPRGQPEPAPVEGQGPQPPVPFAVLKPPIRRMTATEHLLTVGGGLVGGLAVGYAVGNTLAAAATYPDAVTTVFSVIVTFLLIGRRLENWLYWIIIDLAYVGIYWSTGALLFALMMIVNVGMAVDGYRNWRSELAGQRTGG